MAKAVKRLLICSIWASALLGPHSASGQDARAAAVEAALDWLILLDNRDYAGTWESAADIFQAAMSRRDWIERIAAVKTPLGSLVARSFKSSQGVTNPAGAPEGEYLVIRFNTRFENRVTVETVVMRHGIGGSWKVSGYFIRPSR